MVLYKKYIYPSEIPLTIKPQIWLACIENDSKQTIKPIITQSLFHFSELNLKKIRLKIYIIIHKIMQFLKTQEWCHES